MVIDQGDVAIEVGGSTMHGLLARPRAAGRYPGVLFYSDIFQLTGPMRRITARLAGYGFVVFAPEIYHRVEPAGTAIPFDDAGRDRGMADARDTAVAEFDADARAALRFLAGHGSVRPDALAAAGFCLGGHLAFRAALQPDVKATTCFYPTGVHDGKLARDPDAGTLARLAEIRGDLLVVFGEDDPHVPEPGRRKIADAFRAGDVKHQIRLFPAEHAFMRDEGPRYDPEATDGAFGAMIELFRRSFGP